jgi:hypothetical protein
MKFRSNGVWMVLGIFNAKSKTQNKPWLLKTTVQNTNYELIHEELN